MASTEATLNMRLRINPTSILLHPRYKATRASGKHPPMRASLLLLLLPLAHGFCPPLFYLSDDGVSCQPCPPCRAPFEVLAPCGPGPSPGVCGSGIRVELRIGGADGAGLNLTAALAGYSGLAAPAVEATGLDVILRPCPTASEYRSLVDFLCHPCQTCAPPIPVEAAPCVTAHDRVCIPPIAVMLQANGTDLILDPSLLAQLLSTLARNGFNASFSTATYDQVYVTRIVCPPDHFRSQTTGLCTPCTPCPAYRLESVPCTPDADRVCGTPLVSGFLLQGAPFTAELAGAWNLSLFQFAPDGNALALSQAPCPPSRFRSPLDNLCRPCTECGPGEFVLRNCSSGGDRICSGAVALNVSALRAAGVNVSALDLPALQAVLAAALAASQPVPLPAQFPLAPRDVVGLTLTPLPCPQGAYLDLSRLACLPCTQCAAGAFLASPCTLSADARCQACRTCGALEAVVRDCSAASDRVCGGSLGLQVYIANGTFLNRTFLVDALLGRLLAGLPPGSSVDAGYLDHWNAVFSVIAGAYVGYDVSVERLRCTASQYADPVTQRCLPCSTCAATAYQVAPCTNVSDAVCAACGTCAAGQYEACPCGPRTNGTCAGGNRVCYAYSSADLAINVTLLAQYTAADLSAAYLPAMQAHIRAQTLAATVTVRVAATSAFQGTAVANGDGTVTVFYGSPAVERILYPIAGLTPSPTVLRHALVITLGVLYAQPNPERDFSVLIERGLRSAESFLVPAAAAQNATARRRLLASNDTGVSCPQDSYAVAYPFIGPLCVPCQNDPVLAADASTPPALRWQLASSPCPLDYARACPGGNSPPQCVPRFSGALLVSATGSEPTPLACPSGQASATDPATGSPLCVGVPCPPGYTGVAGYCFPCPPGAFKPAVGDAPCTPCPANTFAPTPAAARLLDCLACQNHSTSLPGASVCTCDAGYTGPACAPCSPGTYKFLPGNASCAPCQPGGLSQSPASLHCLACAAGAFAPAQGLSACLDCGPGLYQNLTGASGCAPCAPGYVSLLAPPRTSCAGCPAGVFSPTPGGSACQACQPGTYSRPVASACTLCANGTGVSGQACVSCRPGEYGVLGLCFPCPPGAYNPAFGRTACVPCAPGGFTNSPGAIDQSQCLPCPETTYWTPLGCLACPANTASPRGSLTARDCLAVPGFYGLPGQRALACPSGSFCPQASMAPSKCPDGAVSAQGSQACTVRADTSLVHQFDGLVAASWFLVTFLGIACLVRTKRFWRRRADSGQYSRY